MLRLAGRRVLLESKLTLGKRAGSLYKITSLLLSSTVKHVAIMTASILQKEHYTQLANPGEKTLKKWTP
jgi:hypothetical protein